MRCGRVSGTVVRHLCPGRVVEDLVASGHLVLTGNGEASRLAELERLAVGQAFRGGERHGCCGQDGSQGDRAKKKSEGPDVEGYKPKSKMESLFPLVSFLDFWDDDRSRNWISFIEVSSVVS